MTLFVVLAAWTALSTAADLAKWICRERCYVRQQCLAETLRAEQGRRAYSRYGIAGGLT
ncbi:WhiB family transcriptional regulator, partial [Streptomyces sp. A73]|nr:WhiB family transcriptional regulator [Streptomyces sp. A73]